MTHKTLAEDLLDSPPVVTMERRHSPDRRAGAWRGGRRDTDWMNRPPDALARLPQRTGVLSSWRDWFTLLGL